MRDVNWRRDGRQKEWGRKGEKRERGEREGGEREREGGGGDYSCNQHCWPVTSNFSIQTMCLSISVVKIAVGFSSYAWRVPLNWLLAVVGSRRSSLLILHLISECLRCCSLSFSLSLSLSLSIHPLGIATIIILIILPQWCIICVFPCQIKRWKWDL